MTDWWTADTPVAPGPSPATATFGNMRPQTLPSSPPSGSLSPSGASASPGGNFWEQDKPDPNTVLETRPGRLVSDQIGTDDANRAIYKDPNSGKWLPADDGEHLLQWDPAEKKYKLYTKDVVARPWELWDSFPGRMLQSIGRGFTNPGRAYTGEIPPEPTAEQAFETAGVMGTGGIAGGVPGNSVAVGLSRPQASGVSFAAMRALGKQLPDYVTPEVIDKAESLIRSAAGGPNPVTLTWPEAISQVVGRPVLTDVQRVLESSPSTRATMQTALEERPRQVADAGKAAVSDLASTPSAPSTIGPTASDAAEKTLSGARKAINQATQPDYAAAEAERIRPEDFQKIQQMPRFQAALKAVRNDRDLGPEVAGFPDDSVKVIDAVKKFVDSRASVAAAKQDNYRASVLGQDAAAYRDAAVAASPDYAYALSTQKILRETYLDPLLQGPLGRVANSPTTRGAIDALFPSSPLSNSEGEISTAVGALAKQNSWAAAQLVRAHAEMAFNEASRTLQTGANPAAGAKFVKTVAGNSQQSRNLQAAVEALPGGPAKWQGFKSFLDVMSATGWRQPKGSMTAFNKQELDQLSVGGKVEGAVKTVLSPEKLLSVVKDKALEWRLGKNLDQLATILIDPRMAPILKRIAGLPPSRRTAQLLAGRAVSLLSPPSVSGQQTPP